MKPSYSQHIEIARTIRFGQPCITGTRIAVSDVLAWLAEGMSVEEILEDYPELSKEQILAAVAYADSHK